MNSGLESDQIYMYLTVLLYNCCIDEVRLNKFLEVCLTHILNGSR